MRHRSNTAITSGLALFVCQLLLVFQFQTIHAQAAAAQEAQTPDYTMATVGGHEILFSRVERHVRQTIGDRDVSDQQRRALQAVALQKLVKREIVNHFFDVRKFNVGKSQIRFEVDLLTANLETVGQTLDEFLSKDNRTQKDLDREISWKLRWKKYLDKHLTEEALQTYFDRNRKKFDGTEVKVAQILFALPENSDNTASTLEASKKVLEKIRAGELTWKAAVESHSIAESTNNGGVVGWIRYREPMTPEFSQAAFSLEPGQIAEPFSSRFGIHLVKCLEVKAGSAELGDVRGEVQSAAARDLFEQIADRHQTEVTVEIVRDRKPSER